VIAEASIRAEDFRAALELALAEADGDERIGPRLRATRMRLRFEFPDCGMVLNLAAESDRELRWSFSDQVDWRPDLELRMDSAVANRYLQGRESLAIAIARGRASYRGSSRVALQYLPAARLICEPYRRVIERGFPALVAAAA
jgi:hypothetical protein